MTEPHASSLRARWLVLNLGLSLAGCDKPEKTRTFELSVDVPRACADVSSASTAELRLAPLGDFAAPTDPQPFPAASARDLDFPQGTRAVAASAEGAQSGFLGYSEVSRDQRMQLLLWPAGASCRLDTESAGPLSLGGGQALGYAASSGVLLIAGGNSPLNPAGSVSTATFDAGSGAFLALTGSDAALAEPRAFATITEFGDHLLVAGGENPFSADSAGLSTASQTAELFDPNLRRFTGSLELAVPRTEHAALALADGSTLLVGGRGPRGNALNILETINPSTERASIADLPPLRVPRLAPSALALDDGRLFVGGGTAADGTPIAEFEWLSSDASAILDARAPPEFTPRIDRAFAALPGGGVLAVGGCQESATPCSSACRAGCPPLADDSSDSAPHYDAFWIAPDDSVHAIDFPFNAPRPVLLGGRDGRPLLSTGDPNDTTLYRFDPWKAAFEPSALDVAAPPLAGLPSAALDEQAFLWLSDDASGSRVFGVRSGTRNHFAIDTSLVSGDSVENEAPPYPLVPDRPTSGKIRFDAGDSILLFDADADAALYVAGTDYAGLTLDLTVEGASPIVVLGNFEVGGAACPWPAGAASQFRVERGTKQLILSSGALRSDPCAGPSGRVRLGFKRGSDAMGVRHMQITRSAD